MKTKIEVTNFGRVVKEIPSNKFDCFMTHIYINNLTDEAMNYLTGLFYSLPAEELQNYMVHHDGNIENLLVFFFENKKE